MAHYAKLDENNIVLSVEVVGNSDELDSDGKESEEVGRQFLENVHGWSSWKKCSYNSKFGKYYVPGDDGRPVLGDDQSKCFRKSYPGIGWTYDSSRDAFLPPRSESCDSWVLNETTCDYEAPVAKPSPLTSNYEMEWDESNLRWTSLDDSEVNHYWDPSSSSWKTV
jgi:hypothetical protein